MITLELFLIGVNKKHMTVQVGFLIETSLTIGAGEAFLPSMGHHVELEVVFPGEAHATQVTIERFDTRVCPMV